MPAEFWWVVYDPDRGAAVGCGLTQSSNTSKASGETAKPEECVRDYSFLTGAIDAFMPMDYARAASMAPFIGNCRSLSRECLSPYCGDYTPLVDTPGGPP